MTGCFGWMPLTRPTNPDSSRARRPLVTAPDTQPGARLFCGISIATKTKPLSLRVRNGNERPKSNLQSLITSGVCDLRFGSDCGTIRPMTAKYYTTEEAAAELGLTGRRVRVFCREGKLGTRIGRNWAITEKQLRKFSGKERLPGRPKQDPQQ